MTSVLPSLRAGSRRLCAAAMLIVGTAALAGCAGGFIADHMPTAAGGLPESAPQRPATPAAYPAVHDLPPARTDTMLTGEQQKKLEEDLIQARKRAEDAAKPAGTTGNP